jgi:hypothetical protein
MSDSGQLCGTILWESKTVRNWSDKWIKKLIECEGPTISIR